MLFQEKGQKKPLRGIAQYADVAVIALAAMLCFVFFQFWYPYHFFYQEQNQLFLWSWDYVSNYADAGGLATLVGDFLTQFYYYLYAGATILALLVFGIGLLLSRALSHFGISRWAALAAALAVMAIVVVCHFDTGYRLSSTVSVLGWSLLLYAVSMCWHKQTKNRLIPAGAGLCAIVAGGLLFGLPKVERLQKPDFALEKNFAVDNEYHFGNYDKVVDMVRNSKDRSEQMLFFYNLVMAQRGELPDHLLDFTPNVLGTFYRIGSDTPRLTIINMNELYWALGDMTFTERAAMMTNVFAPDNRNVRMIKRLAECNFVSGDSLAAEKYLRLLDKTFAYSQWARNLREHGKDSYLYQAKMQMVNRRDTITISDNAHFLMMQLLDSNSNNCTALDYLLCSDLLLKDIANFKRDYDRYCTNPERPVPMQHAADKTLYQEALCIWLAGTDAPEEEWQRLIKRKDVMQRFIAYNRERGSSRYKDTYWYYFDKQKAPKI